MSRQIVVFCGFQFASSQGDRCYDILSFVAIRRVSSISTLLTFKYGNYLRCFRRPSVYNCLLSYFSQLQRTLCIRPLLSYFSQPQRALLARLLYSVASLRIAGTTDVNRHSRHSYLRAPSCTYRSLFFFFLLVLTNLLLSNLS